LLHKLRTGVREKIRNRLQKQAKPFLLLTLTLVLQQYKNGNKAKKKPSGLALKLLNLVDHHGLALLAA